MRKIKFRSVFILGLFLLIPLTGCNVLSSLIKQEGEKTPLAQLLESSPALSSDQAVSAVKGEQSIKLFFPDKTGKNLIVENRTIPKTVSLAKESAVQWIKGPQSASGEVQAAANPETVLKGIALKDGAATVDLSKEFLQAYGKAEPQTVLYGLVNTLTQFSTVQSVRIRIEGEEIKTFRGQKTDQLIFNNDLVEEAEKRSMIRQEKVFRQDRAIRPGQTAVHPARSIFLPIRDFLEKEKGNVFQFLNIADWKDTAGLKEKMKYLSYSCEKYVKISQSKNIFNFQILCGRSGNL